MRVDRLILGTLLGFVAPPIAAAQNDDIVVVASPARAEIERILNSDYLDINRLSPREVADSMADIPRGRAPAKFWSAYQEHVRAWQDYADARDRSRAMMDPMDIDHQPNGAAIADAQQRINPTFDEVEVIARHYRARIPAASTRF